MVTRPPFSQVPPRLPEGYREWPRTTKWPPEPVFVGGEPQTFGAGSTAVDAIIRERQPLLGLHGHIHESAGVKKIGRTTCVNPGSDYTDGTLRGAVIALQGSTVKGVQRTTG